MSMLDAMRFRLYMLMHRREHEREAAEEIEFHLGLDAMQQAAADRSGLPPADARHAARRHFGNVTYYREELRRVGGHAMFDALFQDIRFALRSFRRAPTFAIVAVLTLAVGIGANTAIFSAVDALLLRPLPYREPERLMNVSLSAPAFGQNRARDDLVWSYPKFLVFRDGQTVFEELTLWSGLQFTIRADDDAVRESGEFTDAHYFSTLGVPLALGRSFLPDEDRPGARHVVVISDGLWHQLYHADPGVRGKTLSVDGTSYEIVGVAPPTFHGLSGRSQFWVPIMAAPAVWADVMHDPYNHFHHLVGRLKAGATPEQAKLAVRQLGANVDAAYPVRGNRVVRMGAVANELDALRVDDRIRRTILILFGAVGLVLLISCANVANLFLVRASSRKREIATRLALGASRGRLVRQLLVESVLLSLFGGAASVAVAWAGVKALSSIQLANLLRLQDVAGLGAISTATIQLDSVAFTFTAVVAIGAGILFGLVPALQSTKPSLTSAIKEDSAARGRGRALSSRNVLVMAEIALAVVVLAASGLMIRSLAHLLAVRPGFDAEHVLTMRVNRAPAWSRDSITRFYDVALLRLAQIPGVTDVAMIDCPPLNGCTGTDVTLEDRPPVARGLELSAGLHWVTPTYFSLLNIPVVRGRTFDSGDRRGTRRVVIVSEYAARQFWPGEDPIGRPLKLSNPNFDSAVVVGIVGDVNYGTMDSPAGPDVYISYYQAPISQRMMLFVRTRGDPSARTSAVRTALREVAPGFPMYDVSTMTSLVESALAYARFSALLLTLFAVIAVTLAAMGTYGVMSFVVAGRTRELGVRSALGATRGSIMRLVVGEGMMLAVVGVVVGVLGALAATRLLGSLLFDVRPTDPPTLIGIVCVLLIATLAATLIPARRAVGIPVVEALRTD